MSTINESLKTLFLGLGGDSSKLADNKDVSDYIDDLESAIAGKAEAAAEDIIDDTEAGSSTTYSSSKIESLIPENELPTPAAADIGKVVSVVSDGESGAEYALETPSGGGAIGKWGVTVQCNNGVDISVTLASGITRDDLCNPATNYDINIGQSAYLFYISADYSVMSGVNLTLNSYIQTSGKSLPVFTGILVSNNAGSTGSQGDLYQVIFILGATAAGDRLEVIKLTTT